MLWNGPLDFDPDTGPSPTGGHVVPWDGWSNGSRGPLAKFFQDERIPAAKASSSFGLERGCFVITNELQYRATKAHLERFDQAAANIEARPGKRTKLDRLELDAVRAQADDLRAELADFDRLRGGTLSTFDAASLEELSTVLVKARIARGWTQRQLAEALGMAEQQIQRYEANDYRSTSLARLCDIANALGVTVAQHAELKPSAA